VDVSDFLINLTDCEQIAVISSPTLPEPSLPPSITKPIEDRRIKLTPPTQHQLCKWPLEPRERSARRLLWKRRQQKQVQMLGHDHPRKQLEPIALSGLPQMFDALPLNVVIAEERKTMEAGERQIPGMSRHFVSNRMATWLHGHFYIVTK